MLTLKFQFDEDKKYMYFEDERCAKLTKRCLRSMYIAFIVLAIVFGAIYIWFYSEFLFLKITGMSMQPTLNPNITTQQEGHDGALVDLDAEIDYGDIIIIKQPDSPNSDQTIIKRVLAFEGDKIALIKTYGQNNSYHYYVVRIKNNSTQIEILKEDYILYNDNGLPDWESEDSINYLGVEYDAKFYQNYIWQQGKFYNFAKISTITVNGQNVKFYQLGEDEIFYLGDNRAHSSDARYYGPVKQSEMVVGKVVKIIADGYESNLFFVRAYYQLKGLFGYFMPKLLDYFAWKG